MDTSQPRYEFRAWGDRLGGVAARLASLGEPGEQMHSTEVYLVAGPAAGINAKVRKHLLDIKVLEEVRDGFERWDVALKQRFPLSADLLNGELVPLLGVGFPAPGRDRYSLPEFLEEVVAPHPDLAAVEVEKHRRTYTLAGGMAEIADVLVAGVPLQTAAVESADFDAVREARRAVGLDTFSNESYPRVIRRTLGWNPDEGRP